MRKYHLFHWHLSHSFAMQAFLFTNPEACSSKISPAKGGSRGYRFWICQLAKPRKPCCGVFSWIERFECNGLLSYDLKI